MKKKPTESLPVAAAASLSWGTRWPSFIFTHEDLWVPVSALLLQVRLLSIGDHAFKIKKKKQKVQFSDQQRDQSKSSTISYGNYLRCLGWSLNIWLIFTAGLNNTTQQPAVIQTSKSAFSFQILENQRRDENFPGRPGNYTNSPVKFYRSWCLSFYCSIYDCSQTQGDLKLKKKTLKEALSIHFLLTSGSLGGCWGLSQRSAGGRDTPHG